MRILLCSILITLGTQVSAQQVVVRPTDNKGPSRDPLIMVDSFTTSIKTLLIDPNNIKSVDVLKDSIAVALYGAAGKNGVVLIHTKPNTTLLRLNALLDKFEIPDSLRKYRVCINEALVAHPELILIDDSQVTGVTTLVSVDWNPPGTTKDEKLLNIISKGKKL